MRPSGGAGPAPNFPHSGTPPSRRRSPHRTAHQGWQQRQGSHPGTQTATLRCRLPSHDSRSRSRPDHRKKRQPDPSPLDIGERGLNRVVILGMLPGGSDWCLGTGCREQGAESERSPISRCDGQGRPSRGLQGVAVQDSRALSSNSRAQHRSSSSLPWTCRRQAVRPARVTARLACMQAPVPHKPWRHRAFFRLDVPAHPPPDLSLTKSSCNVVRQLTGPNIRTQNFNFFRLPPQCVNPDG